MLDAVAEVVDERRCAVITTGGMARRGTLGRVADALGDRLVASYTEVEPNPSVASCVRAFDTIRDAQFELLVALGGGSAIDTAKAVAAQCAHRATDAWLSRHLRNGAPIVEPFAPPAIVAIPTTAGTGSEVTMWATIWDERTSRKHSLSHPALYAEAALLDPTLTLTVPHETTVASAFDALSHAMEAVWNRSANPISDALAARAISVIPRALLQVLGTPDDAAARETLLAGSLLAGLAISHTRTALAHSISYPLTGELGLPHGVACSITLPELLTAVDARHPRRAALIVAAMGATSATAAARDLDEMMRLAGTREVVLRHVPGTEALRGVRETYIAPGRAENFILDVDQAWAADLLARSLQRTAATG